MIYIDMDGVMSLYDYSVYQDTEHPWDALGAHTFRNSKPDPFMQAYLGELVKLIPDNETVLTNISPRTVDIKFEQMVDKLWWIKEYYSMMSLCNVIFSESDKRNSIERIRGMKLCKSDILIDDYNKNLYAWLNAGGTAIKYLNCVNSKGMWPGLVIDHSESVESAIKYTLANWYGSISK